MMLQTNESPPLWRRLAMMGLTLALSLALFFALTTLRARAQAPSGTPPAGEGGPSSVQPPANEATGAATDTEAAPKPASKDITLWDLFVWGGWLMIPIYIMGIIATAAAIERGLALRRSKVIPPEMVEALGELGSSPGGFDPRKAYRICQQYPSAASTVIRAMLLKVGRPHSEVEHTVKEVSEREAARLYANVGWLTLAGAVSPLFGLFGTIWGMILAFHDMTLLTAGANRALQLAEGIYVALITTLGGLFVAIPAVMAAHFFEQRIVSLFHEIDELLFSLLPQVERFEGRLRVSRQTLGDEQPEPERHAVAKTPE
jgi:biopolymer transport protein ExbB